jgi:hypothetical protein
MHRKKKKNTKPSYERTFEHKTNILRPWMSPPQNNQTPFPWS